MTAFFVEADWLQSHGVQPSADGAPVDVGNYQGYFLPQDSSGTSTLYVDVPNIAGERVAYLELFAHGLTQEQVIAVAQSGLPTNPAPPSTTPTCTEVCG